ncbi:hypothetical protein D3C71_1585780 [compost metagenome]
MIDRAAAGQPPDDLDIMVFDIFLVDLFDRILMLADNDGRTVNIEQKVAVIHGEMLQHVFLNRQIDGGVRDPRVVDKEHDSFLRFSTLNTAIIVNQSLLFHKKATDNPTIPQYAENGSCAVLLPGSGM